MSGARTYARTAKAGGGGVAYTGILMLAGGVPLDSNLRNVTDQANTASKLYLSTTQALIYSLNNTDPFLVQGLAKSAGLIDIKGATTDVDEYIGVRMRNSAGTFIGQLYTYNGKLIMNEGGKEARLPTLTANDTFAVLGLGQTYTGANTFSALQSFSTLNTTGNLGIGTASLGARLDILATMTATATILQQQKLSGTLTGYVNSGTYYGMNITPVFESGTFTGQNATALFVNANWTTTGGGTWTNKYLMDLWFNGTSKCTIDTSGALNATGGVTINGTSFYKFSGYSTIASPSNGTITLYNSSRTDFSFLQFGGVDNTFVALKRSANYIQAKLADDSAFCFLQGKLTTSTAATTGLTAGVLSATTNATIVVYDSTGQAYRIPCII